MVDNQEFSYIQVVKIELWNKKQIVKDSKIVVSKVDTRWRAVLQNNLLSSYPRHLLLRLSLNL